MGTVQIFILQFTKCEGKSLRIFALQSKIFSASVGFGLGLCLMSVSSVLLCGSVGDVTTSRKSSIYRRGLVCTAHLA